MKKKTIFQKIIYPHLTLTYVYETDQSIGEVTEKMEYIIAQKRIINRKYYLYGKIYPDHSFYFEKYPRSYIRYNLETILGTISTSNHRRTKITIEVRPNFIFVLFSGFMFLVGISAMIAFVFNQDKEIGSIGLALFLSYLIVGFIKRVFHDVKPEFEYALDLPKNDEIISSTIRF